MQDSETREIQYTTISCPHNFTFYIKKKQQYNAFTKTYFLKLKTLACTLPAGSNPIPTGIYTCRVLLALSYPN